MAEINFAFSTEEEDLLAVVTNELEVLLERIKRDIRADDNRTYATLYSNNSKRIGVNPYGEYVQDIHF